MQAFKNQMREIQENVKRAENVLSMLDNNSRNQITQKTPGK